MNSIGGYFELELNVAKELYPEAIKLNTARNAFEYILKARKYIKVYIPYFICDVLLQPLDKLGISYEYYTIDKNFEPIFDFKYVGENEAFLFVNYFGVKDKFIKKLSKNVINLIVDNAQAFYSKNIRGVDTFYSPRKFFGLPDGAYLFSSFLLNEALEQDKSFQRVEHLLRRLDVSAEDGYLFFVKNEKALDNLSIKKMSTFTQSILRSIDYNTIAKKRRLNFDYLHQTLGKSNNIIFDLTEDTVPMVYPFYSEDPNLRRELRSLKIYTAQYWPNVLSTSEKGSVEYELATNLVHLPIDQRYGKTELDTILEKIVK